MQLLIILVLFVLAYDKIRDIWWEISNNKSKFETPKAIMKDVKTFMDDKKEKGEDK